MTRREQTEFLIERLLSDMPAYRAMARGVPDDPVRRRALLRGLMNLRPPTPLSPEFLAVQDALLSAEREEKGVVWPEEIAAGDSRLLLWRGDITRLAVGAIVNAGNSALLGCFAPCHGCIDNAIHSAAGLQLRDACHARMRGGEAATGTALCTDGYNLPARYVLHTVGPIVQDAPTDADRRLLADCYRACMRLADELALDSIAFCCISTGVFHFPNRAAAAIAVDTVRAVLSQNQHGLRVIFDVFTDEDERIYRELLGGAGAAAKRA